MLTVCQAQIWEVDGWTHNKEAESDHHCFHSDIEVHGELDPKIISVCKDLSEKAGPLFTDSPDTHFIHGQYLPEDKIMSVTY